MLTVIILARNQSAPTCACLDALARAAADLDVRLVDNASRDDTPSLAREDRCPLPWFTYRRSPRNLGFAAANNRAARYPAGDVLLFLNNDVQVARGALSRLLEAVVDSGGGIAGPKSPFPEATIEHAAASARCCGSDASNLGTGARRDEPVLDRGGVDFAVTGAMLAVGRRVFQRLRWLRRALPWGYEDADIRLKVHQAGADVRRYVPEAESVHAERATLSTVRRPADLAGKVTPLNRRRAASTASCWLNTPPSPGCAAPASSTGRGVRHWSRRGRIHRILQRSGIVVVGFTASTVDATRFVACPSALLIDLHRWRYDRLLVASEHYYAVR